MTTQQRKDDSVLKFITPSRVDEFIQFKSGSNFKGDEYTIEDYIDRLLKIEDPAKRRKADAGQACHYCLEHSQYDIVLNSYSEVTADDNKWTVNFQLDDEIELPVIRESWVRGTFAGCQIIGKVDAIDAVYVHDHKFTSQVDIEKYMDSVQWKMYLLMTGRDRFVYNLFNVKIEDTANIVNVLGYSRLELCSYDGMAEEIEQVITDYRNFLIQVKPLFIKRIAQYNGLINQEIARLVNSPLVTCKNALIDILNSKRLKEIE